MVTIKINHNNNFSFSADLSLTFNNFFISHEDNRVILNMTFYLVNSIYISFWICENCAKYDQTHCGGPFVQHLRIRYITFSLRGVYDKLKCIETAVRE